MFEKTKISNSENIIIFVYNFYIGPTVLISYITGVFYKTKSFTANLFITAENYAAFKSSWDVRTYKLISRYDIGVRSSHFGQIKMVNKIVYIKLHLHSIQAVKILMQRIFKHRV